MKVAIIGAGKMGRWFTRFCLEEGDSVVVASRSEDKLLDLKQEFGVEIASNVDAVKKAERILICVPLENFEEVVKEIGPHVRSDQVVMDICSIKEAPVKMMHKYVPKGLKLGTHPVFGPGVPSLKNQNFVLTPTNQKEKQFAEEFKNWLQKRGANVSIMSPREHDERMSVVLGFPHFLGLVICDTLLDYPSFLKTEEVSGTSYKMMLTLAEAVASEDTGFYTSLQMNLPKVEDIEGLFLKKCKEWFNIVKQKDKSDFSKKMNTVKSKLEEVNPEYHQSYDLMHKILYPKGKNK
ncbi:MAG: prephenate dehydrogenase/arogenate dehydrogenase family protein [Thermoproteota archaeon]